jgi:hypothetical protein
MAHFGARPSAQVAELAGLHHEMHRLPRAAGRTAGRTVGAAPAPRTDHQSGPPADSRPQMEAPNPLHVHPRPQTKPRIEGPARQQPLAGLQHQGPVRLQRTTLHQFVGPFKCRPRSRLCQSGTTRSALGSPLLSSQSQLYQPARPPPICTSQGQTLSGGAARIVAIVARQTVATPSRRVAVWGA